MLSDHGAAPYRQAADGDADTGAHGPWDTSPRPVYGVGAGVDFETFVRHEAAGLMRMAWLLSGDRGTAEDLLQTALAKTYPRWSQVRRYEDPVGYVRRVMVNTRTSWWRRHRSREHLVDAVPEPRGGTDDHADAYGSYTALLAALRQLPAAQRKVVVLRYYADLSEREVADTLGCAAGTVKSQASRGLARLRELLDPGTVPFTSTEEGPR